MEVTIRDVANAPGARTWLWSPPILFIGLNFHAFQLLSSRLNADATGRIHHATH